MKKFYLLFTTLCCSVAMMAQSQTFVFVDDDGNTVPDGTTINITAAVEEEDPETGETWLMMPTGLSVKNVSPSQAAMRLNVTIQRIDNGTFQVCFPMNCLSFTQPGDYQTPATSLPAAFVSNLLSEWLPDDCGICNVKLQIEVMNERGSFPNFTYTHLAYGPTVNVAFNNGDVQEHIAGDIDGSGIVDVDDVNAAINLILNYDQYKDKYPGKADIDGSGIVDVDDVNMIINIILNS